MPRKYTKKQVEMALKISNDIAEFIDCGESRQQLREAVSYWADQASKAGREAADLRHRMAMYRNAMKLANICLGD